jgi:hypothetical protein
VKKVCVACGKGIPRVALDCVFCGTKQPTGDARRDDEDSDAATTTEIPGLKRTAVGQRAPAEVAASMTDPTLMGLRVSDVIQPAEPANGEHPSQTRPTAALPVVPTPIGDKTPPRPMPAILETRTVPLGAREDDGDEREARPWAVLGRIVMGLGGVVMIALFYLPWHGVTSWQLLETLGGADFMRQLFYLTGGVVLAATAALPLPFAFRAAVGAAVAAVPVLLGAGGVIEGWRGPVAGLAILGLPAAHLLRFRVERSRVLRGLVYAGVAAIGLLYLVPISSVVPIVSVLRMMSMGSIGLLVMAVLVLLPLVFAALSLLGVLGRDLTDVGVLLSVAILLWAPMVVALRGLLMEDTTQLYVALALLWSSATASLSLAQLLSLARPG